MKFVVFVTALVAIASAFDFENDPEFEAHALECSKEHSFDISGFQSSNPDFDIFETHEAKCFLRCLLVKSNIMKDDVMDLEVIKQKYQVGDDVIVKTKECMEKSVQTDPCEKVYEIEMCVMKKINLN
ncbi:PREDICTED: uncharacterized protein LOC108562253 [Nicrophorus vespilloides]|uniref:Uncharacterized protein LOC108562253 n=1 Tax=Nicrophorus vespilloides TaxID=110193 RepID=A0ABM1MN68_NICVS|nr:PREDICTED: uncharacterized protein LOC108562253 [Nicrophorus vespilloides]